MIKAVFGLGEFFRFGYDPTKCLTHLHHPALFKSRLLEKPVRAFIADVPGSDKKPIAPLSALLFHELQQPQAVGK